MKKSENKTAIVTGAASGMGLAIARTALFLVCSDSSFLNGTVVTADGGWTAY